MIYINKYILKYSLLCLVFWVVVLSPVYAEGLYVTLGAGKNEQIFSSSSDWNDANSTGAFIAVYYKWNKQNWCKCYPSLNYAHLSQYESGAPWNNKSESTIDHIGIAGTWAVYER